MIQTSIDLTKRKWFHIEKKRQETEIITDADYADDLVLLMNTPAQAGGIGSYINANKTVFMWFKQGGALSTPSGEPLKLADQFTYLSSNISSTESDINICLVKAWNAIDWLLDIWKSDLSDKMKQDF